MHSGSLGQFGGYLRAKWLSPRRIRFWLLVLLILYTLLGFFAVPWAVKHFAVSTVEDDFNRELQIETVRANPFTLTLRIDDLILKDTDEQELISWDRLSVDLAWASIINRAWTFKTIRVDKAIIQEERFASGETRFSRLAARPADEAPTDDEDEPETLPSLRINDLRITDAVLRFTDNLDNATADNDDEIKPVSLTLQDIGLSIKDFTLQEATRSPVSLEAQLAEGGMLTFDGTLQLQPFPALEGSVNIDELALIQAAPYLQHFAGVKLDNGTLSLSGQMQTSTQQPFAFQGHVGIHTLRISQGPEDETLIGWQRLHTEQIDLNLNERELETGSITVEGLAGRIVINEDQTTNFGELRDDPPAEANGDAETKDDENTARTDKGESEERSPFSFTIEGIELTDAEVHFADNSLPLPFSTDIHSLNGELSTLSSSSAEPARLNLEGEVEDYGLARAEGTFHAFEPTRQTNIKLTFRNLQIPEYSPYTVDFAGRAIAGGTMDLDLEYTIDDEQIEGENKLVIRDLELGEKIESSDAMDLPLDLAIALLKDSDGVIDITLPVTGDVSNPEFDFSAIIREALAQAFTSVIEAPFRFLASLIGSDSEDLGQIEFAEGRTDLLPPQRERIIQLREALQQRPALILELAGPFSRSFDGPALKREKAIEALRQHLAEEGREAEDPSLTSESNQDIVEAMFSNHYPQSNLEAVQARFTESQNGSSNDTEFDALAYRNYLADQIIAAQSVTDDELGTIANDRASAIRNALVNENEDNGITDERVRILEPTEVDSVEGERIVMEIGVTTD